MRLLVLKLMAVLVLLTALGSSAFGIASADIDGSGKVDFNDLVVMQKYWLGAGPVADIGGADGNSDGVVDGLDFSVLGGSWHTTTSEVIGPMSTEGLGFSEQQAAATHTSWSDFSRYPYITKDDNNDGFHYDIWGTFDSSKWTSGFFPGCLWYMYELTGDPNYSTAAQTWMVGLEGEQYNIDTHDVGFIMMPTYGLGYRLTGEPNYVPILIQTAESLATRYNPIVGCTRSWSWGKYSGSDIFPVIIDNMMNLEILFWASKNGGGQELYDIAISHAYKTIENHVRGDGTTNHIVIYDPCDGSVIRTEGRPGYSADSCWSLGHTWGIYGFTMCYRETGDPNFLETAKSLSNYFVDNLPADFVPYYDFLDPNIPNVVKDSAAASVGAAGLLELSTLVSEPNLQQKYFQAAKDILTSLCRRYSDGGYLAKDALGDPIGPSILMRGYKYKGNLDERWERGVIWADYYFVEALMRYKAMTEP